MLKIGDSMERALADAETRDFEERMIRYFSAVAFNPREIPRERVPAFVAESMELARRLDVEIESAVYAVMLACWWVGAEAVRLDDASAGADLGELDRAERLVDLALARLSPAGAAG